MATNLENLSQAKLFEIWTLALLDSSLIQLVEACKREYRYRANALMDEAIDFFSKKGGLLMLTPTSSEKKAVTFNFKSKEDGSPIYIRMHPQKRGMFHRMGIHKHDDYYKGWEYLCKLR